MAAGATLRFSVEVAADQATRSMSVLSQAFNEAGISAKRSLLAMGSGSSAASAASGGLEQKLKSLKGEMASGDRTINFFARSLNGIVPEASAAGQGLRLLADGLIGGLGVGFAIQATMAVLQLFGDSLKETERKAAESAKAAKDTAEAWYQVGAQFDAAMAKIGAPKKSWQREQVEGATAETDKQIEAAEKKLRDVNADLNQALNDRDKVGLFDNGADERVVAALAEKQATTETLVALRQTREGQRAAAAEKAEQAAAALTDASTAHTFYEAEQQAREKGRAKTAADASKAAAEEERRLAERAKLESDLLRERLAGEQEIDQFVAETGERQRKRAEENAKFWKDFHAQVADVEANIAKKEAAEAEARVAPIVAAWTNGFAAIAMGSMTVKEALRSIGESIVQLGLQMAQKAITAAIVEKMVRKTTALSEISANAGIAGSGAAASVAAVPIVGPALAAAAMAQTSSLVLASMLPLASAAQGFDIPAGLNPVTQLHQKEMVLPADIADPLRRSIRGGGGGLGGGFTMQVAVNALDGRSAERVFTDRNGAIQKSQRKIARRIAR
jgi:hypothetical protein